MDKFFRKIKKRIILEMNKLKGEMAETIFDVEQTLKGNIIIKHHEGYDRKVIEIDPLTGEIKDVKYCEIKSSYTAPLSKTQKKFKKKLGKKYKVVRYNFGWF